jgi:recombination protein RecA
MPKRALTPQFVSDIGVFRAADMQASPGGGPWQFDTLVGILAEISEEIPSGAVSFTAEIIAEAQAHNEPVAWIAAADSLFFPPDMAERGVDLNALAVIRVGGEEADALTAAEWLVRSGAVGLVVVDTEAGWKVSDAALGRLQRLSERSQAAVVFLTRKRGQEPSLGSRISLRGCIRKSGAAPFLIEIYSVRDKRSNRTSRLSRRYHGPSGMH